MIAQQDPELILWVMGIAHGEPVGAGHFLQNLISAVLHADADNYQILRPALLELKNKFPSYRCSCEWAG